MLVMKNTWSKFVMKYLTNNYVRNKILNLPRPKNLRNDYITDQTLNIARPKNS